MRCKTTPICVYMQPGSPPPPRPLPSPGPFCFACLLRPILFTLNKIHVIYIQVYETFKKKKKNYIHLYYIYI